VNAQATELRLGFAARAENLALVRQALAGFADAVSIGDGTLADLKQIATEACMNAVVHAYPGEEEEGRVDVVAVANAGTVEVRVRDWGVGFRPRPAEPEGSLRLGLPLIATVAESFQIASPADGGTELTARVRIVDTTNGEVRTRPPVPQEAEMAITAGASARPVIARVLAIAATRAGFSLERMSDGVLLGDAIAAGEASDFEDGRLGIGIEECGPNLCVRVGPLVPGGGERLLERMKLPGLGVSITKLATRVDVETGQGGESLVIEIAP
jgi:anti-sigma regulatory factor (Ser/Thr protein kinase)